MENKPSDADKRTFFRFEYPAPVRYRFAKKAEDGKYLVSPWLKGVGVDFSGGGAAIKVGKPLPPKTLMLVEIRFPYGEEPIMATVEVVRRVEVEYKGATVYQLNLRYLLIDRVIQDKMVSFIISRGKVAG